MFCRSTSEPAPLDKLAAALFARWRLIAQLFYPAAISRRLDIFSCEKRSSGTNAGAALRSKPAWLPMGVIDVKFLQGGGKFGGVIERPIICRAGGARPPRLWFRTSVSDHRQKFGYCPGLAISSRRMKHCLPGRFSFSHASTRRTRRAKDVLLRIPSKLRRGLAEHLISGEL